MSAQASTWPDGVGRGPTIAAPYRRRSRRSAFRRLSNPPASRIRPSAISSGGALWRPARIRTAINSASVNEPGPWRKRRSRGRRSGFTAQTRRVRQLARFANSACRLGTSASVSWTRSFSVAMASASSSEGQHRCQLAARQAAAHQHLARWIRPRRQAGDQGRSSRGQRRRLAAEALRRTVLGAETG